MKSFTKIALASLIAAATAAVAAPPERNPLSRGANGLEHMNARAQERRAGGTNPLARATPAVRATPATPATPGTAGTPTIPATPATPATPAVPPTPPGKPTK